MLWEELPLSYSIATSAPNTFFVIGLVQTQGQNNVGNSDPIALDKQPIPFKLQFTNHCIKRLTLEHGRRRTRIQLLVE